MDVRQKVRSREYTMQGGQKNNMHNDRKVKARIMALLDKNLGTGNVE